jgi:hypothetical protein
MCSYIVQKIGVKGFEEPFASIFRADVEGQQFVPMTQTYGHFMQLLPHRQLQPL